MFRAAFYKGTRPGFAGAYNYVVRTWTDSPYSHVELIFSDGMAGSASFADGGVRLKAIELDPARWDFMELPAHLEPAARAWFESHAGAKYDLLGNLQFILTPFGQDQRRWFCSEACGAALSLPEPWRYDPPTLASALTLISIQPASAGFLMPI
ncbi:hypothetical protein ASC94_10155 [Massilia sp. Root418]|uniref:hypothetical protein n=1 Tax=Massilia sp. Root418 TaxID=1736532 RepID=UPI000701A6A1|nr:hypothetical protein [Massilia sp. Root418]KQW97144.1 hypothetical protein ASC94_10155 [Massilia sp. Root418]